MAAVLKTVRRESVSGVRIPIPPFCHNFLLFGVIVERELDNVVER